MTAMNDLPEGARRALELFLGAAREALGADLRSAVLFGSAAEGRMRPTSDVNLILVLRAFDPAKVEKLRDAFRAAHAAAQLRAMFLLEAEIPAALESFADKFADVLRRRRVIHGDDPFAGLSVPRAAEIARLRERLLNLALRLREAYVSRGVHEEKLALVIADAAGPLRVSAATLLELEGKPAASAKEALAALATDAEALAAISEAREKAALPPGRAGPVLLALIDMAGDLRRRAEALR